MKRFTIQAPDGRTVTIEGETAPNQQQMAEIFSKITPQTVEQPVKEAPKKGILGQTKTAELNEGLTSFEKFALGALPVAGAIIGGTSGFVADVLTPFTPGLETYVGGGLGAAAGRALSDKLRPLLGGKDVSMEDLAKRATIEGVTDVIGTKVVNVAMPIVKPVLKPIGKAIGTPIKKVLEKVAKPALKMESITDDIYKLKQANKSLKKELSIKEKGIKEIILKGKTEASEVLAKEEGVILKTLEDGDNLIQSEINKVAPKISRLYDLSRRVVSRGYDNVKKEYGDIVVDTMGAVSGTKTISAKKIVEEIAQLTLDTGEKVGKKAVEKTIKGEPTVGQLINLERELDSIVSNIYRASGSAKNTVVNDFIDARSAILNVLEEVVPEQKILNDQYRNLMLLKQTYGSKLTLEKGVKGTVKIGDLIKPSPMQSKASVKVGKVLEDYKKAIIEGKIVSPEEYTSAGKEVIDTLEANLDAIRYLNPKEGTRLHRILKSGEKGIQNIQDLSYTQKGVTKTLEGIKKNSKIPGMIVTDEAVEKIAKEIEMNKTLIDAAEQDLKVLRGIYNDKNLMSIWILSETVGAMPFVSKELKVGFRLMASLFTVRKWSPTAAQEILKGSKAMLNKLDSITISNRNKIIIKNAIEAMLQIE